MASPMNVTLLEEMRLPEGQRLKVIQGDLSKLKVNAVVHPTSSSMYPNGQVGRALREAGGEAFQASINSVVKTRGTLSETEAAISGGGNLPATNVIHVYSPSYGSTNSMQKLDRAVINCLNVAGQNEVTTLAFPSIGSGDNKFPKVEAARRILRTIKQYFRTEVSSIEEIYFVLFDKESLGIYRSELGRMQMMHGADGDDENEEY